MYLAVIVLNPPVDSARFCKYFFEIVDTADLIISHGCERIVSSTAVL